MMKPPRYWKHLVRAPKSTFGPEPEAVVQEVMKSYNESREAALERMRREFDKCEYWVNDLYQVEVRDYGGMVQLNIRRRDGQVGSRDWRHFQQIKNELVGPENEAVELYPAESRLVDTSNKYHLWVVKDPEYRFPFGFNEMDIRDDDGSKVPGLRQRKF